MHARRSGPGNGLSRRIYALLGAAAAIAAVGFGPASATAGAVSVLEQAWENTGAPYGGLLSDLPSGSNCGALNPCRWTRWEHTGLETGGAVAPGEKDEETGPTGDAKLPAAVAPFHNYWHVEANPQEDSILSPAIDPNLVALAPGDNGHLPSAYAGTNVAWFGEKATGTFCGIDFQSFGNEENSLASLNGCTSSGVEEGALVSPPFSLEGATSAILHFFSWWEIESVNANEFDIMGVDYSTDKGAHWTQAGLLNPAENPAGAHYQPYSDTGLQSPPQWTEDLVDLTPAIPGKKEVEVRFRFDTRDQLYQGFRGWLIDNVRVATPSDVPAPAITSVDTCSGTKVAPVTVIHGTNFLIGSKVSLDGGEPIAAQTPSSDHIEITAISAGAHTLQVVDPNGTIKSNVFSVTQPSNCVPSLPPSPPPPVKNQTPPENPPVEKGTPVFNPETGEIEVEYEFPEPGEAEDEALVSEGASIARFHAAGLLGLGNPLAAVEAKKKKGKKNSKKCKKGFVKKGKKCVSTAPVQYGFVKLAIPAAGKYKLHIKPTSKVLAALKKGKTLNVKLTLTFTPKGTTKHIVKVTSVKVHLKQKKKHGKRKGKKGKKGKKK